MKTYLTIISILLCLLLFNQCGKKTEHTAESYYANLETGSKSKILIDRLHLDSIVLENIPSSFIGFIRVFNDTIYFIDEKLSYIFPIDNSGNIHEFRLGAGRGPSEYPGGVIYDYVQTREGDNIILGVSHDLYIYDKNWEIKDQKRLDWQIKHSMEEMEHNPQPDMPGLYSFVYNIGRDIGRIKDDYIYYEVFSNHPTFNLAASRDYYRKGRLITKLYYKTGIVEKFLGIRSLAYENYEHIGHFSFCSYDADTKNNKFYLGFQADSLIYVCNSDFIPIRAFGRAGRDMNTSYTEYSGRDLHGKFGQVMMEDYENCGYYEGIEYIEERDLLFRSYIRGPHADYDGLQIYHNEVLVADVDVPKGFRIDGGRPNNFKIKGYIEPYFISNIKLDFYNERGVIYKFKLDI